MTNRSDDQAHTVEKDAGWDDCGHHPEWSSRNGCRHPDCLPSAEKDAPRTTVAQACAAWEAKGPTSLTVALMADALYGVHTAEMRAFVAGWFAHARNPKDAPLLVEEAWHAYRLTESTRVTSPAECDGHYGAGSLREWDECPLCNPPTVLPPAEGHA